MYSLQFILTLVLAAMSCAAKADLILSGDVLPSDPTFLLSSSLAYIGKSTEGAVDIDGNTTIDSQLRAYLGYESSAQGHLSIIGPDASLEGADLYVGYEGRGSMVVANGGQVDITGRIANYKGSVGRVLVDGIGSKWTSLYALYIGEAGTGELEITNGGIVVGHTVYIGNKADSRGRLWVDGAGSGFYASTLTVGWAGDATLRIADGGSVSSRDVRLAQFSPSAFERSDSDVVVEGIGSRLTVSEDFVIGNSGKGTLSITKGGFVSVGDRLFLDTGGPIDSFINMSTGGRLALFGEASDSIDQFLKLVGGEGAIRYFDFTAGIWTPITEGLIREDYTLEYIAHGEYSGYTLLTVGAIPEPTTLALALTATLFTGARRRVR